MKLLIVEDSVRLSAALTSDFRREGFAVDHAGDRQSALLPRVSGLEVLGALRASQAPARVLVLSARDQIGLDT